MYNGLLLPGDYPAGGVVPLTRESVAGITHLGGTILGTTNRGNPMKFPVEQLDGSFVEVDRTDELIETFDKLGLDALVTVGGDGSLAIGYALAKKGLRVIGVPKTIDNDLDKTVVTFGFDTAVSFATECLDRLHTTATATLVHMARCQSSVKTSTYCGFSLSALSHRFLRGQRFIRF